MSVSQPLSRSARPAHRHEFSNRIAYMLIAVLGGMFLFSAGLRAQGTIPIGAIVTDQTPLNLSHHFGVPAASVVNQAGDYAFIGENNSALFLRVHTASSATRILQFGDAVPGISGATATNFNLGGLNASANLLFFVSYNISPADGRTHRAILLYNSGTATFATIATSDQVAANSGGQMFGPSLAFPIQGGGLDNNNDVAFTTTFEPFNGTDTVPNQNTLYIAPAAGTPVRVVGLGDTPPGITGSTFVTFNGGFSAINALGQVVFNGQYFNGTTTANGLFLGASTGVTKVVANGDAKPVAIGGNFAISAATRGFLNNNGNVAFVDNVTPQSAFLYSGTTPPARTLAGVAGTTITMSGLSDQGSAVATTTAANQSIVRIHSTGVTDTIATTGATFSNFFSSAIEENNAADSVSFYALFNNGGGGVYTQTGTATPQAVAVEGQSTPLSGGAFNLGFNLSGAPLKALNNGSTFFAAGVTGGTANYGQFIGTPGSLSALMSTADTLPNGAKVRLLNPAFSTDNGGSNLLYTGFDASLAGGQNTIFTKELVSGVITRVVGEGDVIPGTGGESFILRATNSGTKSFYMNDAGQMAFPAYLTGSSEAILIAQPTGGVNVIEMTGNTAPISGNPHFYRFGFQYEYK